MRCNMVTDRHNIFQEQISAQGILHLQAPNLVKWKNSLVSFFGVRMDKVIILLRLLFIFIIVRGRKKAHKHKLFALVNVQMPLGQTAGCPRVNRAKSLCVRLETQEI